MTASTLFRGDDANLPVTGTGTSAVRVRGLIAVTTDPVLIKSLQDLAASGTEVNVVSDLRYFTDQLLLHTGDTALIDAVGLEEPLGQLVDVISRQLPDLRLMVAGHGAEQQQLGPRVENHTVFRFVHKPVSPQRLKLLLDAAARPENRSGEVVFTPATTPARQPLTRAATSGRGNVPRRLALISMIVIAAVSAAAWVFWPDGKTAPGPDTPAASSVPATTKPQVVTLLSQAQQAFAAGRFVASDGSSAAELYRAVLKLDTGNKAASKGYDLSRDQALQHAEEALLAGRLNDASTVAAAMALLEPGNSRLTFLNTQITRETARLNANTSQRQAFEAQQAQMRTALTSMKDRVQRGALLDPAADSAVASFRAAEAIGVNDPAVRAARETLVAALLTAANADLGARRLPAARRHVEAARSLNSNAAGLDALLGRIDEAAAPPVAPVVAPEPVKPAPRVETPAPVAAAPVEAATPAVGPAPLAPTPAAAPAPVNEVVSARTLRLLRSQDPVYPEWALQQLISGWVELEFTVTKDGSVKDITVVNAEPKKTFNSAATSALARYRYAPVIKDGAPVNQRATIRMRFTAQDSK